MGSIGCGDHSWQSDLELQALERPQEAISKAGIYSVKAKSSVIA